MTDVKSKYIVMLLFRNGMIESKKYWENILICRNVKGSHSQQRRSGITGAFFLWKKDKGDDIIYFEMLL